MTETPAILGGKPLFDQPVPIVRPTLPAFEALERELRQVLSSGMVTKGRYLAELETRLAERLQVAHVIGLSSCTSGLMLAFKCLGLRGSVVCPSFTFMATVSAQVWCGLRPVFVDVDYGSTNLDAEAVEKALRPDTCAIVAVHNFGAPADVAALEEIASRRGLPLVFDAAHGIGSLYQGKPLASQGTAQVFSMSPTKLLIAGEGGILATDDAALAERVRLGREYGNDGSYDSAFAGMNARLPEFSAILALKSLEMLDASVAERNRVAARYRELLGELPGLEFQQVRPGDTSSYKDFSVAVVEQEFGLSRDELARALAAERVSTRKYYDPPVHRHTAYNTFYDGQPLPNTELLAERSLSLPIWSGEVAEQVAAGIRRIWIGRDQVRGGTPVR